MDSLALHDQHAALNGVYRQVLSCLTFSVLSKTMVFLSATIVQGGCGKCLFSWEIYKVHSDAIQEVLF